MIVRIVTILIDGIVSPGPMSGSMGGGSASFQAAGGPITENAMRALLLPRRAVAVRRLHASDRGGWLFLIALIALIGAIRLLVWYCTGGTRGANRFGPDPRA